MDIRRLSASLIYSDMLEALQQPEEKQLLIDHYVSKHNALGSHYGMLAYQLGFTDCKELFLEKIGYGNRHPTSREPKE